jgi:hypothetical protein
MFMKTDAKRSAMSAQLRNAVLACAALLVVTGIASGQTSSQNRESMHGSMPHDMEAMHARMMQSQPSISGQPTLTGQDAFGAIQEIVRMLEADPKTDWSKVNIDALREHLIDMNDVTLNAEATPKTIDGGLEIAVTGNGRTLGAIQRMVPAHAQEINGLHGWDVKAASLPSGALLTVTSSDSKEAQHIRALGFIGILVSGTHHQAHHLMMAKGEAIHAH